MRSLAARFDPRLLAAAVLVLALAAALTGLGFKSAAAHDPAEHVREVLARTAAAFERGDLAALDKIWADDPSVTVFESGHANYGWADYRDSQLAPELKDVRYALSDIRAKVSGATAWATFKYALSGDASARRVEVSGLGTAVLERRG